VGVNAENGKKLLFTVVYLAVVLILSRLLAKLTSWALRDHPNVRISFWTRQAIHVLTAVLAIVGVISIWFDNPARLTPAVGFLTAGLAFASQKVVTALAGYFVILRGRTFNVGDRIVMGGVRGDVIALSLMQTTIMEMGEPPPVQSDAPAVWVEARQYTGRIVNVSNAAVFDQPVFNYTRDFPYLWEEMRLPVSYQADRTLAERILLDAAKRHTEISRN
jgi:small-conductance mechanosensitive channel